MNDPMKVGVNPERLSRVRPVLEKHIGDDKLAGVVVLVARRGETVYFESLGEMERETQKKMQPDTGLWTLTCRSVSSSRWAWRTPVILCHRQNLTGWQRFMAPTRSARPI
jgi:hypothetical protein